MHAFQFCRNCKFLTEFYSNQNRRRFSNEHPWKLVTENDFHQKLETIKLKSTMKSRLWTQVTEISEVPKINDF